MELLPHTTLSSDELPHTMLSTPSALPHTTLLASVLPHTMLSQSAPAQSLPHTALSPALPHTMLSMSQLPHTTLLPQTMLSQAAVSQFSPQTTFWPEGANESPHTMLSAHAVPPGVSTPPLTRRLPHSMCLLQAFMLGYGSPFWPTAK